MSLCRRYLNLLVNEHIPGVKSLRFIDLKLQRQRLFYPGTPPRRDGTPAPASEMETLRLPRPSFTFRPGDSDDNDEWRILLDSSPSTSHSLAGRRLKMMSSRWTQNGDER
jgi:hypothetical protein